MVSLRSRKQEEPAGETYPMPSMINGFIFLLARAWRTKSWCWLMVTNGEEEREGGEGGGGSEGSFRECVEGREARSERYDAN